VRVEEETRPTLNRKAQCTNTHKKLWSFSDAFDYTSTPNIPVQSVILLIVMSASVREYQHPIALPFTHYCSLLLPLLFSFSLFVISIHLPVLSSLPLPLPSPSYQRAHASRDRCPLLRNSLSCQCPTLHPSVRQTQKPLSTPQGSCWVGFLSSPSLARMVDNLRPGMCHACTDHSLTAVGYSEIHQPTGVRGAPPYDDKQASKHAILDLLTCLLTHSPRCHCH
jgi:hypothetical protein